MVYQLSYPIECVWLVDFSSILVIQQMSCWLCLLAIYHTLAAELVPMDGKTRSFFSCFPYLLHIYLFHNQPL